MSSRLSLRTVRDLDLQTWRFDSAEPDESAQGIKLFISDYQSEASPESSVAAVGLPPQEWSGITILQANAYFGLKTYSFTMGVRSTSISHPEGLIGGGGVHDST